MGTYLTARILEQLIKKHREDTFLIILGFMLVSLRSLLPEHLIEENLLAGVGALVLGFVSLYFVSKVSNWKIERYFAIIRKRVATFWINGKIKVNFRG